MSIMVNRGSRGTVNRDRHNGSLSMVPSLACYDRPMYMYMYCISARGRNSV